MSKFLLFNSDGEIVQTILVSDGEAPPIAGFSSMPVPDDVDVRDKYIYDGAITQMPLRPSDNHKFNYTTKQWVVNVALAEAQARQRRATLLQQSDWTQLPDVPLATKEAWAIYRQDLRDVTSQPGYPTVIYWPVAPG